MPRNAKNMFFRTGMFLLASALTPIVFNFSGDYLRPFAYQAALKNLKMEELMEECDNLRTYTHFLKEYFGDGGRADTNTNRNYSFEEMTNFYERMGYNYMDLLPKNSGENFPRPTLENFRLAERSFYPSLPPEIVSYKCSS